MYFCICIHVFFIIFLFTGFLQDSDGTPYKTLKALGGRGSNSYSENTERNLSNHRSQNHSATTPTPTYKGNKVRTWRDYDSIYNWDILVQYPSRQHFTITFNSLALVNKFKVSWINLQYYSISSSCLLLLSTDTLLYFFLAFFLCFILIQLSVKPGIVYHDCVLYHICYEWTLSAN